MDRLVRLFLLGPLLGLLTILGTGCGDEATATQILMTTPTPTPLPTAVPRPTPLPTAVPTPTPLPTATLTPTPLLPTATLTPTPLPTAAPEPTTLPTATPTPTPKVQPSGPMFRADLQRTGVYDTKGVEQLSGESWHFTTTSNQPIFSSPTVADGTVYIGSWGNFGSLYAVDVETGQRKWRFRTGDTVFSSPAITDGIVYFGSADGHLYAVDAMTGQEKWRFKTDGGVSSSQAITNEIVYFGSNDEHLYAVDAMAGQEKWRFKTDGGVSSSPAIANGTVYFGSNGGIIFPDHCRWDSLLWKRRWNSLCARHGVWRGEMEVRGCSGRARNFVTGLLHVSRSLILQQNGLFWRQVSACGRC